MKTSPSQVPNSASLHLHGGESHLASPGQQYGSKLETLAHELRQPLSVIESLAFYLELTSEDDNIRGHFRQIQAMVKRANCILSEATSPSGALS